MPRLLDLLFEEQLCHPAAWAYNFGRDPESPPLRPPGEAEAVATFRAYRDRAWGAPAYVADEVAALYYGARDRPEWDLADLPNMAPPALRFWLEMARPRLPAALGLPPRWGFFFEAMGLDDLATFLERAGRRPSSSVHWAFAASLAFQLPGGPIVAPAYLAILQVARDGRLAAPISTGYPFPMDPEKVSDQAQVDLLVRSLVGPTALALALLNGEGCVARPVAPSPRLQKARTRRGRRPHAEYREVVLGTLGETLRYRGMAGVVGLPGAIAQFRHLFPPAGGHLPRIDVDTARRSAAIVVSSSGREPTTADQQAPGSDS